MTGCLKNGVGFPEDSPVVSGKTAEGSYGDGWENIENPKVKLLFDECLENIFKELASVSCYRPLPAVVGQGQEIDLHKLYLTVRNGGGFLSVSKNCLWSSVAVDCGLDSDSGAALKLVYFKYLDTFDRLLGKLESGDVVMGNGENDDNSGRPKNVDDQNMVDGGGVSKKRKRECYMDMLKWIRGVARDPCNANVENLPEKSKWKSYGSNVNWKQILWARNAICVKRSDVSSQQMVWQKQQKMHPSMYDDDQCSLGRLRYSQRLTLAKDTSRKARERPSSESSSGSQSDVDGSNKQSDPSSDPRSYWEKNHRSKRVSIGKQFQAELPEFCGAEYESDSKWLGTKTWPLEKGEYNARLIERDPIGKGRQESCGCQFPGSRECVRFHVQEKRMKTKFELGPAFYKWKFDGMGEEIALSWTKTDESKFQEIVDSNRLTSEKYFWDELFKYFHSRGREALVSYYFNVFLLRRRAEQNRSGTKEIDSDDEDAEYGPIANKFGQLASKSIFCSPKKSHPSNSK